MKGNNILPTLEKITETITYLSVVVGLVAIAWASGYRYAKHRHQTDLISFITEGTPQIPEDIAKFAFIIGASSLALTLVLAQATQSE